VEYFRAELKIIPSF